MAASRADKNRAIRQDALRAQLSANGHLTQACNNIRRLEELDPGDDCQFLLIKYKTAAELHLRLVAKYLPDLKSIELKQDVTKLANRFIISAGPAQALIEQDKHD